MENFETNNEINKNEKPRWKVELIEWIKSLAFAVIAALLIVRFIFSFTVVRGESMMPTLHNGDRLIELKIDKLFYTYTRGDIVVIKDKEKTNSDNYVKRIIAVGGDRVQVTGGDVFVNNEKLDEEYIFDDIYTEGEIDIVLNEDEVFVIGDNRLPGASKDSRYFGPVNRKSLKGRCVLRVFPFNRFGGLN
ncbi:MAG: signal peptidase I [Firmicutes bacterium]|nr:signal peptidase I [Ezakiella sp.]MDD7761922.1 signal peptidase I [Bacillota bacterium]